MPVCLRQDRVTSRRGTCLWDHIAGKEIQTEFDRDIHAMEGAQDVMERCNARDGRRPYNELASMVIRGY